MSRFANKRPKPAVGFSHSKTGFGGRSMCLKDWARSLDMDRASLAERLRKWPLDKALTVPKQTRCL